VGNTFIYFFLQTVVCLETADYAAFQSNRVRKADPPQLQNENGNGSYNIRLELVDSDTDVKITNLMNGSIINLLQYGLSTPSKLSIHAIVTNITNQTKVSTSNTTRIRSVQFGVDGNLNYRTENYALYSMCGNKGIDHLSCGANGLTIGKHVVTVTLHSGVRGRGKQIGEPLTTAFDIIPGNCSIPKVCYSVRNHIHSSLYLTKWAFDGQIFRNTSFLFLSSLVLGKNTLHIQ
jgi:hypothetical protein